MYVRPQGNIPPRPLQLPRNYSGNAFREIEEEENEKTQEDSDDTQTPTAVSTEPTEDTEALLKREAAATSARPQKNPLGSEELLLLALAFLLSDSDMGDDLVLFLILLLFIK